MMELTSHRGWGPRLGRWAGDAALRLRSPARLVFGSLRTAVFCFVLALTAILFGQLFFVDNWSYRRIGAVEPLAFIALLSNVGLIYGTFNSKVHYVYGWMSFSILRLPLILICGYQTNYYTITIGLPICLFHFALEVILLALVHGYAHEESRGGYADGGWLQQNLATEGQQQEKLPLSTCPAILTPSACTTTAPLSTPTATSP